MRTALLQRFCVRKRGVSSHQGLRISYNKHIMPFRYSFRNPVNNFQIMILNASFDMIKLTSYTCSNPFTALHAFQMVLWIVRLSFIDIINHCNCIFIQICMSVSLITARHFAILVQLFWPTMHCAICADTLRSRLNMAAAISDWISKLKCMFAVNLLNYIDFRPQLRTEPVSGVHVRRVAIGQGLNIV